MAKKPNYNFEKRQKELAKKAKKEDVKVGARVVIDAKMDTKMKMLFAEEVKLGATATKEATHDDHKK